MKQHPLSQTGLFISEIGLGTVKFGRNQGVKYPDAFQLPSDTEITHLLHLAKEVGINFLDTAPAYGESEERLGKLLKGQRHHWVLGTKVGEYFADGISSFDFSAQGIEKSLYDSLKRLQTDYLDIVLVHSNGNDMQLIENGVFEVLHRYKEKGYLRAFGMSTKTIEGGLKTIEIADVAMVTYNQTYQDEKPVIIAAHKNNKAILIKKALGSGHLAHTPNAVETALQFVLQPAGVTSVVLGTINPNHLHEWVKYV